MQLERLKQWFNCCLLFQTVSDSTWSAEWLKRTCWKEINREYDKYTIESSDVSSNIQRLPQGWDINMKYDMWVCLNDNGLINAPAMEFAQFDTFTNKTSSLNEIFFCMKSLDLYGQALICIWLFLYFFSYIS